MDPHQRSSLPLHEAPERFLLTVTKSLLCLSCQQSPILSLEPKKRTRLEEWIAVPIVLNGTSSNTADLWLQEEEEAEIGKIQKNKDDKRVVAASPFVLGRRQQPSTRQGDSPSTGFLPASDPAPPQALFSESYQRQAFLLSDTSAIDVDDSDTSRSSVCNPTTALMDGGDDDDEFSDQEGFTSATPSSSTLWLVQSAADGCFWQLTGTENPKLVPVDTTVEQLGLWEPSHLRTLLHVTIVKADTQPEDEVSKAALELHCWGPGRHYRLCVDRRKMDPERSPLFHNTPYTLPSVPKCTTTVKRQQHFWHHLELRSIDDNNSSRIYQWQYTPSSGELVSLTHAYGSRLRCRAGGRLELTKKLYHGWDVWRLIPTDTGTFRISSWTHEHRTLIAKDKERVETSTIRSDHEIWRFVKRSSQGVYIESTTTKRWLALEWNTKNEVYHLVTVHPASEPPPNSCCWNIQSAHHGKYSVEMKVPSSVSNDIITKYIAFRPNSHSVQVIEERAIGTSEWHIQSTKSGKITLSYDCQEPVEPSTYIRGATAKFSALWSNAKTVDTPEVSPPKTLKYYLAPTPGPRHHCDSIRSLSLEKYEWTLRINREKHCVELWTSDSNDALQLALVHGRRLQIVNQTHCPYHHWTLHPRLPTTQSEGQRNVLLGGAVAGVALFAALDVVAVAGIAASAATAVVTKQSPAVEQQKAVTKGSSTTFLPAGIPTKWFQIGSMPTFGQCWNPFLREHNGFYDKSVACWKDWPVEEEDETVLSTRYTIDG